MKMSVFKKFAFTHEQGNEINHKIHRLRHIDTHLAYVCTMPFTYSGKNSYAEPVLIKANIKFRD